jgi:hypothetical protein
MVEKENLYKYACICFVLSGICLMTPMGFIFSGNNYASLLTTVLLPTGIVLMFSFMALLCMGLKDSLDQMKARTHPELRE